MTDEEKEAIHKLKSVINNDTGVISDDIQDDEIETILGLINKQQKEIVRLRHINTVQEYTIKNSFSKDKIKEKIEFYKGYGKIKNTDVYVMSVEIEVLKELLEE